MSGGSYLRKVPACDAQSLGNSGELGACLPKGRERSASNILLVVMAAANPISSYVLCIDNGGYPESLEVRKVYSVLPDELAEARQYVRVIDETGEDYLYPSKYFVPIQVSPEAAKILTTENARNGRSR